MGFDFVVMFIAPLLDDVLYVGCCIGDIPWCIYYHS
jgi:hypothetical protein